MLSESETRQLLRDVKRLRSRVKALERQGQPGARDVSWMGAVGMLQMFPGLRGLWPMSAFDSNGDAQDMSGHGLHLTMNSSGKYAADALAPYCDLDGAGDYFSRADEANLDITGTEGHVDSTIQGLTLGGWFSSATINVSQGLITKFGSGDERSYLLYRTNNQEPRIVVSSDGASTVGVTASSTTPLGPWYFTAGRFTPSSELAVWLDAEKTTETTSIPASIHSGTAELSLGAFSSGLTFLDGRASLCFLAAAAVPDSQIAAFYQYSKGLFA